MSKMCGNFWESQWIILAHSTSACEEKEGEGKYKGGFGRITTKIRRDHSRMGGGTTAWTADGRTAGKEIVSES